jgi:hypothetical protein
MVAHTPAVARKDGDGSLEARIAECRTRRDAVYRRLGKHIEGCKTCARADSLHGPPLPFCSVGERLLVELSHARWELDMAVMKHIRLQPVDVRANPKRAGQYGGSRSSPRPFGTHPRHHWYSN